MEFLSLRCHLFVLLSLLVCALSVHAAPADKNLRLPTVWKVQPATNVQTPPIAGAWGEINSTAGDWRGSPITNTGAQWPKPNRETVNSLWYEQTLAIPAAWNNQRIVLDFRRLEGDAIVFVDGKRVCELLRPGGEVEITDVVRPGQQSTLHVFVTRSYQDISRGFEQDKLRYLARQATHSPLEMKTWPMGITGPVTLIARPRPAALTDVFLQTSLRQKTLTLDVETDATTNSPNLVAVADIFDAQNQKVLTVRSEAFHAAPGRSRHVAKMAWPDPIPWELDKGYLYTARVRLERENQTVDAMPDMRFGFREIWISGREMFLNGHPLRFRLSSLMQGGEHNANALSFFRLIGYNTFIFQNNPTAWWRNWAETPLWNEEFLDEADRVGAGISMAAPSINFVRTALLNDLQARADYEREMEFYLRRYRNRASVLVWTVGMNSYNPRYAISPQGMGRREAATEPQPRAINEAVAIAHKYDPTRPAHSHADGGTGDISSANVYLNFVPLQEREEWPSSWAASGDMPFAAIEFGQPYTANLWQGKRFFLTEYMAMYFGDKAYRDEKESGLRRTVEYSLMNKSGHGAFNSINIEDYPIYWDFQRFFVRHTNRSWRTWGVNGGWSNWVYDIGYGNPPGLDTTRPNFVSSRYRNLKEPVTQKPSWVNPNFEIHQQANQPLLAYIAGAPVATDKMHTYYSGETVRKNIALVWDGPGDKTLTLSWKVSGGAAKPGQNQQRVTLRAGDIKQVPVTFTAPAVNQSTLMTLEMTAQDAPGVSSSDRFALQIFPRLPAWQQNAQRIALYDPANRSAGWLAGMGVKTTAWKAGDSLQNVNLLIIGREALGPGRQPPYTSADIARGLRVLVLEQKPEVWEGMGFRITDKMPRYVFARDTSSPILSGLQAADLINWRGSPNLLPKGVTRPHDVTHAPKWTNRHAVASVALQIPEAVGFTSVLVCEFDLNYSPLLQMQHGKGEVTFCTLDLTDRVGTDPAATLLARNLLRALLAPQTPTRNVQAVSDIQALQSTLHLAATPATFDNPNSSLVLVGAGANAATLPKVASFVQSGGTALHIANDAATLKTLGYATKPVEIVRATGSEMPLLRAVGPNLLRWRDALNVNAFNGNGQPDKSAVFADGLLLVRSEGNGQRIFWQVEPSMLSSRYADDEERRGAIQTSVSRLKQLTAQILTNAGAGASAAVVQRLSHLNAGPAYQVLSGWQVLGPFPLEKDDGEAMLNTKFPGEDDAIAGDTNPNTIYTRADGAKLDWRKTVTADAQGAINLGTQLNSPQTAVAYLSKIINSKTARTATLQLGADFRLQVWVNGQIVFRTLTGRARPNVYQVKIPLRAGENIITMKVGSGSKGFVVWPGLSTEESDVAQAVNMPDVPIYHPMQPTFDPYEFHYW